MWFSAPRRCYQLQGEQHVVQNNLRVFGLRLCCVTCGCVIHAQRLRSVTTPRRRGCAGWFGMRRMAGWRAGCSDWPNVLDGMKPTEAAGRAGMDRQTLRDWAIRCNAEGIEGLCDRPKSGRPTWLDDGQLAAFKALVLRSPDPERDGVSTWRAKDLCRIVEDRFGVSLYRERHAPAAPPIERVWLYLRQRFLSHRLWLSHDDILDACCAAWNALLAETEPHPLPLHPRLGRQRSILKGLMH